jgi:hypothetical protein
MASLPRPASRTMRLRSACRSSRTKTTSSVTRPADALTRVLVAADRIAGRGDLTTTTGASTDSFGSSSRTSSPSVASICSTPAPRVMPRSSATRRRSWSRYSGSSRVNVITCWVTPQARPPSIAHASATTTATASTLPSRRSSHPVSGLRMNAMMMARATGMMTGAATRSAAMAARRARTPVADQRRRRSVGWPGLMRSG